MGKTFPIDGKMNFSTIMVARNNMHSLPEQKMIFFSEKNIYEWMSINWNGRWKFQKSCTLPAIVIIQGESCTATVRLRRFRMLLTALFRCSEVTMVT